MDWRGILLILVLSAGCAGQETLGTSPSSSAVGATSPWMDAEFVDVATGDVFKISDFKGKPVLMESFAVWCTTCLKQQKETQKLHETEGDSIIHISIDTDPNEDEERVKSHIETHGFDWYYAISPVETTQQLIDEFGVNIVNAPLAPVILICEDGSSRLLENGVKTANQLMAEIDKGC